MEPLFRDDALDSRMRTLAEVLSPSRPIRAAQYLRGRAAELRAVEEELRYFTATPFIYGARGVGKTSLAQTAATNVCADDREPIYIAASSDSTILTIIRQIVLEMYGVARTVGISPSSSRKVEWQLSLNPSVKVSSESERLQVDAPTDMNEALRLLREVDRLLPRARETVVILDELEELPKTERKNLAHLVKELGDQEVSVRFVLVGISDDVQELIGAHQSVPRYIKEVEPDASSCARSHGYSLRRGFRDWSVIASKDSWPDRNRRERLSPLCALDWKSSSD